MTIEQNLNSRILELELTLAALRETCAFNLYSPGNEDDTLNYIIDRVTEVLHDNYEYIPEEYED